MKQWKSHPGATALRYLVYLSALLTVSALALLVGYMLIKGIPGLNWSLFAWNYTSDNSSMMPAIINTLTLTVLALALAVPLGVGAAIFLAACALRGSRRLNVSLHTTDT